MTPLESVLSCLNYDAEEKKVVMENLCCRVEPSCLGEGCGGACLSEPVHLTRAGKGRRSLGALGVRSRCVPKASAGANAAHRVGNLLRSQALREGRKKEATLGIWRCLSRAKLLLREGEEQRFFPARRGQS